MEFKSEVMEVLLKINFSERAKKLAGKHSIDSKDAPENYDTEEVIKIFSELGYDAKFNKKENFFKVTEKLTQYRVQCHISVKYSYVEIGWYLFKDNKFYEGDVWSAMKKALEGDDEQLMKPEFHSYEELKEILAEAFEMYEDFKRELEILK
ncbi:MULTISPECIES: hypothetical protein [unclassified Clostridium]|uniref:hypothetical protein n=1 Tax=unclassified Clostridium TaxID=2614128 RepID=UPI0002984625|nr:MULTISPECIES: hypothetical protein [unclassified Clostridium]EKQ54368.1 MAG: hypothetical protein A370_03191 [Clostridium sp. Maddingley MBC34-26]